MSINFGLRPVLRAGLRYGIDPSRGYPRTVTDLTRALNGRGVWTGGLGYICDVTSGNISPVIGATTLTAASTPTYSNPGPRGTADRSVGFNSNADSFGGGNVLNIAGTDDLAAFWVGYHAATPTDTLFSKYDGATTRGYEIAASSGALRFRVYDGATNTATAGTLPTRTWYVGGLYVARGTAKMCAGHCALGGAPSVSSETAIAANSASHTVGFALGAATWLNGTSDMLLKAFYIVTGSSVAAGFTATNLADSLFTFASTVMP